MDNKIEEALQILKDFKMPKAQLNDRTALCLLALINLKPEDIYNSIDMPLIGITPLMDFARKYYKRKYAPNTRETFRRFSMHQLVEAGIAIYNPDEPQRPVNSPKTVYQISPEAYNVIKYFKTRKYKSLLKEFLKNNQALSEKYALIRNMKMIPVKIKRGLKIKLSPGEHNELIKKIVVKFSASFIPGSHLLYVGDTGDKWGFFDKEMAKSLGIKVDEHGKMPDVILYHPKNNWLILIESVTSHGPVDSKRHNELEKLFKDIDAEKIYVTAFPNKSIMGRYLSEIAWETEVWIADNPSHMIHFNGDKFLGPYKSL